MQHNHPQRLYLTKKERNLSNKSVEFFIYRQSRFTLICPISAITSQSATPTEEIMRQTHQLLDYIATQEDTAITYTSSHMKLAVHSDEGYLSKPKARSRAFLSNEEIIAQNNGAIINITHII